MKNIFKYLLAFMLVLAMSNISVMAVEETTSYDAPITGSLTASGLKVEGVLNYKDENIPFSGQITASNTTDLLDDVEGLGGDSAKFEGTIGDESSTDYSLNGSLVATVNYNGVDTMFGTVTMADNTKLFINAYFDGEDNAFVGMLTKADPRNETLTIGDLFVENIEDDKIPVRHPVQLANNGTLSDEAILWDVYANDREKVDVELDGELTAVTNESFLIHAKAFDGTHRWVSKPFSSIGLVTILEQENSNFATVQEAIANANANKNETIIINEQYIHNDELVTINKTLTIVGPDQIQRDSQFGQITAGINIIDNSVVTLKDLYVTGYHNIRVGNYGSGSSNIISVNNGSRLIADNIVVHEPDASIYTEEGKDGITSIGIMLARGSSASISNSTIEINNAPRFSYAIYTNPTTAQRDQVISISNNVFYINSGGPLYSDWIQDNIGIMMDIHKTSEVNDTNIKDYVVLNGNSYNVPEEQLEHAANLRVGSASLTEQQVKSIVDIYLPEHGRAHVTWAGVAWQWYPYPDKVTITFDLGVEEMEIDPIYQTINTAVMLPTPERSYYTFDGWYLDQDYTTEFTSDFMPVEDTELYAKWNIHTYTVTFNDYDGTKIEDVTVDHGSEATPPADPTREGYTFTGWDVAFDKVTDNLVVTAEYEINTYTVTFNDYDGTKIKDVTVDHGSDATPPADPTREGHTFNGWNATFTNVTSDLTIVATYLSKVVEADTKDFPKLEVEGLDDLDKLGITFTDEEKEKDVSVILVLELLKDEDVPKADKDLLDAYLEANANIDLPMSLLLDISMLKIVGDSASAINELASPITISFEVPFAFRNIDFELLRVHDGKVESLDYDYNAETFILTFETDKFSTYALAEVAEESEEDETDPVEEPEEDETDPVDEENDEEETVVEDDDDEEEEEETLVPDMSDNGFRNIAYVSMLLGSLLVLLGSKRKLFAKITK